MKCFNHSTSGPLQCHVQKRGMQWLFILVCCIVKQLTNTPVLGSTEESDDCRPVPRSSKDSGTHEDQESLPFSTGPETQEPDKAASVLTALCPT